MVMALSLPGATSPALGCVAVRTCSSRKHGDGGATILVRASDRMCGSAVQGQQLQQQVQQPWRATERGSVVRRSAETASGSTSVGVGVDVAVAGGITEVDKDTFWPFVKGAGEKVVVLDMYTQWCGPCKLMLPRVVELSETYAGDVLFAKLDCNQENKPLAKELGAKTVPTFKIFKNAEVVGEVRGAKYDELVRAIEKARSSSS